MVAEKKGDLRICSCLDRFICPGSETGKSYLGYSIGSMNGMNRVGVAVFALK
jgi:hypothetical protein